MTTGAGEHIILHELGEVNRRRHGDAVKRAWTLLSVLIVLMVLVMACAGPAPAPTATLTPTPTPSPTSILAAAGAPTPSPSDATEASVMVHNISGGAITVLDPVSVLAGVKVTVPAGALGSDTQLMVSLSPIRDFSSAPFAEVVGGSPDIVVQLASYANTLTERNEETIYHPLWYPSRSIPDSSQ